MKFDEYLKEDNSAWMDWVNDNYVTLDINESKLKDLINDFIYKLPKKYSNKKWVLNTLRSKFQTKVSPKEFNAYIDSFDESRLEELVGLFHDAIKKWDGV